MSLCVRAASAASVSASPFALSVAGVTLATYGAYNMTQWLLEQLDVNHPNRLDTDSIRPRVDDWNERLRERLNLDPADIPPPPSPRPSPSPTASGDPEAESGGEPGDAGVPLDDAPTPPVGGPNSYPAGAPPSTMPVPLPVITPGQLPEPPDTRPTSPAPSVFWFPGYPRETDARPTAQPSPAGSPR